MKRIEVGLSVPPEITADAFLNAMDGIPYLVDEGGIILAVGESSWREFADQNDTPTLTVESVVGRFLFDMLAGERVREIYRKLHASVWRGAPPQIFFDFRCDAPGVERYMRLALSAIKVDGAIVAVLYQSQLLHEKMRVPMNLFSPERFITNMKTYRDDQIVTMCSYCHDVAWPVGAKEDSRTWISPDTYYQRGVAPDMVVSHGICPDCYVRMQDLAC